MYKELKKPEYSENSSLMQKKWGIDLNREFSIEQTQGNGGNSIRSVQHF